MQGCSSTLGWIWFLVLPALEGCTPSPSGGGQASHPAPPGPGAASPSPRKAPHTRVEPSRPGPRPKGGTTAAAPRPEAPLARQAPPRPEPDLTCEPAGVLPHDPAVRRDLAALGPNRLALATTDGRVAVLDAAGKLLWKSEPLEQKPVALVFSADGKRLLATGSERSNFVFEVETGKLWRTWHRKVGDRQFLSADGSMLLREDVRHSVRWLQLSRYKMKWLVKGRLLALSGDGTKLLVLPRRGDLEVRDTVRGRLLRTFPRPKGEILAAALPNQAQFLHLLVRPPDGEPRLLVWDGRSNEGQGLPAQALLEAPQSPVLLARSKEGSWVALLPCGRKLLPLRWQPPQGRLLAAGHGLLLAADGSRLRLCRLKVQKSCPGPAGQ